MPISGLNAVIRKTDNDHYVAWDNTSFAIKSD